MNLLVDAQLPAKLCEILNQHGFSSIHVNELPAGDESTDLEIINYADRKEMFVMTKDFDFYHSHMVLGKPKKILLISTGNIKNRQLFDMFRKNVAILSNALRQSNFIELTQKGLIQHD